jgi:polyisoprenoid-binding protein YceI
VGSMRIRKFRIRPRSRRMIYFAALVLGIASNGASADMLLVTSGDIRVTCPMTVGGSFVARTTAVEGSLSSSVSRPTKLAGQISVDLSTLDTGISLRDQHLRSEYLEVGKGDGFEKAVVSDIDLGGIDWEGFRGETAFTGTFWLHGTRGSIAGEAKVEQRQGAIQVEATFPISLAAYGIAEPRYMGVGVKDRVEAKVTLVLEPSSPPGADR